MEGSAQPLSAQNKKLPPPGFEPGNPKSGDVLETTAFDRSAIMAVCHTKAQKALLYPIKHTKHALSALSPPCATNQSFFLPNVFFGPLNLIGIFFAEPHEKMVF